MTLWTFVQTAENTGTISTECDLGVLAERSDCRVFDCHVTATTEPNRETFKRFITQTQQYELYNVNRAKYSDMDHFRIR